MTVITRNARNTTSGDRGSPDARRNTDLPFRKKAHLARFSEIREQVMDAYRSWEVSPPAKVRTPLASLPLLTMLQAVVVSKQSLENWLARNQTHLPRTNDEEDGAPEELSISDILCEHGALDPSKASKMKCIDEVSATFALRYPKLDQEEQGAYDKILASGCNFASLLHTENVCSICVTQTYQGP
jgi:hypothetical protein